MLVVIDISLDLLIETWIWTNKFIMKSNVWLLIDYYYFISNNELLKSKNIN